MGNMIALHCDGVFDLAWLLHMGWETHGAAKTLGSRTIPGLVYFTFGKRNEDKEGKKETRRENRVQKTSAASIAKLLSTVFIVCKHNI